MKGQKSQATLFVDSGSNTTYVPHDAVKHLQEKQLQRSTLSIKSLREVEEPYDTHMYPISLQTKNGVEIKVNAYGIKIITSPQVTSICLQHSHPSVKELTSIDAITSTVGKPQTFLMNNYVLHPKDLHSFICGKELGTE